MTYGTRSYDPDDLMTVKTALSGPQTPNQGSRRSFGRMLRYLGAADAATLTAMQASMEDILVSEPVIEYCVSLVHATRASTQVHAGASPRGVEALVKLARARSSLEGRSYVTPDDVKAVAIPALAHRIMLLPELWVRGVDTASVVQDCLASVPTPPTLPSEGALHSEPLTSPEGGRAS